MPACYLIATADAQLAASWERQIPQGRQIIRMPAPPFERGVPEGVSAVVILDALEEAHVPLLVARHPTVFVGEPLSAPFEQARLSGKARVCLPYEDSARRLRDILPLLEEIADRQAMVELMQQRLKHAEPGFRSAPGPTPTPGARTGGIEWWDFVEGAVECMDSRDQLLGEFRRAARRLLRASNTVFFLRDAESFRADRGDWLCPLDDPFIEHLESRPAVIDGRGTQGQMEPAVELSMRNHLTAWGSRLLVPIHDSGRLLGFISLGVRDDGMDYLPEDNERAVGLARLLRQLLLRQEQIQQLDRQARQAALGAKYLPSSLLLGPAEKIPAQVPVVIRDLIGQVRHFSDLRRLEPDLGQCFRASAGPIAETGGVWVTWEDVSGEMRRLEERRLLERRNLLCDLALTLCHEMGNPLMSLSTFRQMAAGRTVPERLIPTLCQDIARLEHLEKGLSTMQAMGEGESGPVDIVALVRGLSGGRLATFENAGQPIMLHGNAVLLEYCLKTVFEAVDQSFPADAPPPWSLSVKGIGVGSESAALISIKGRGLDLEGALPDIISETKPNQGRMSVFLAKEIIRLHRGEIHSGPGVSGVEIMITLRNQ